MNTFSLSNRCCEWTNWRKGNFTRCSFFLSAIMVNRGIYSGTSTNYHSSNRSTSFWRNFWQFWENPITSVIRATRILSTRNEIGWFLESTGKPFDYCAWCWSKFEYFSSIFTSYFQEAVMLWSKELRIYDTIFDLYENDHLIRETFLNWYYCYDC